MKIMNERDSLRHRLSADRSNKDFERKSIECQFGNMHNEMNKQNRHAVEKIARLEEVS